MVRLLAKSWKACSDAESDRPTRDHCWLYDTDDEVEDWIWSLTFAVTRRWLTDCRLTLAVSRWPAGNV